MKISKLKKNPHNPRFIRDSAFKKLVESIRTSPWMMPIRPIVIDEDGIVLGGNMRFEAMLYLGLKDIPDDWIVQVKGWSEDQKKEFIIKDNASFGEWDWDELANNWDDYPLSDWTVDVPNFDLGRNIEEEGLPAAESQKSETEKSAIVCPSCGHEFHGK